MRPPSNRGRFLVEAKAHPQLPTIAIDGYRVRRDTIDRNGKLTVRYAGHLHHIGMGRR